MSTGVPGLSLQAFRQRALDKQRGDEARVQMLQKSLAATQAMGDANAKCVLPPPPTRARAHARANACMSACMRCRC
jgi:hypothetical protein